MVSYVKAREKASARRRSGPHAETRPFDPVDDRTIFNTPFNHFLFSGCDNCTVKGVLVILAVLTNLTAIQRLMTGRRELSQ